MCWFFAVVKSLMPTFAFLATLCKLQKNSMISLLRFVFRIRFADAEGLLDENDAILMKGNYRNVWIHKCTFTSFTDALINIEKVRNPIILFEHRRS